MLRANPAAGESWLQQIWEQTSDALVLSDPAGIVLAANPAYYRLYGYGPEEVLGNSFALIFASEQREWAEAQYDDVFRGELTPPIVQSLVRGKDGVEHVVESRVSFLEQDGRRVAMLSIIRDVSDQIAAERAAARAEHNLRTVLASLSHDIKSPLAVIKGHAQLLRRHVARQSAAPSIDRLVNGLTQIESSVVDVAGFVDELVALATLEKGAVSPLQLSMLDLVDTVRDSVARHQGLADNHRIVLDVDVQSAPGQWDGRRLARMMDNLLNNAVKYSPAGGTIAVEVHRGAAPKGRDRNTATESSACDGIVVSVEDEGIGIDAHDLPHVFERFHRGCNVPDNVPGSGIGLSSVEQTVHMHGGTVEIASRVGAGTRVVVWLPVRRTDEQRPQV